MLHRQESGNGIWGCFKLMDWDKYEEELLDRLGNDNKMVRLITIEPKSILKNRLCRSRSSGCIKGSPDCFRRRYRPAHFIG
jgi:hypothetical protein